MEFRGEVSEKIAKLESDKNILIQKNDRQSKLITEM